MSADSGDRGFELLANLRQLERRLRRLKAEWRTFRDEPSEASLEVVRGQVERLWGEVRSLYTDLGAPEDASPLPPFSLETSSEAASRPAAREVVQASRELDTWIWQATRGWKEVIEHPGPDRLLALSRILDRSATRAGTLIRALGGSPTAVGVSPTRLPKVQAGSAGERVETGARELEALMWRIQADWQHFRSAPTVERIRLLQEELTEAASCAETLRQGARVTGETSLRRSVRTGLHGADAIRFLPYRDPFTGAYNREGFDALASAELKRCRRYNRRFGLIIIRLAPADLSSLQTLVSATRAELREYDLIARYVDDQLLIGIPEGGRGPTRRVASRILKAMRRSGEAAAFRSLAYATMPEDGSTLSGLMDAAKARQS